jgi:GNAT superfamily N-acetyltransferase
VRVFVGKNARTGHVLGFYSLCVATLAKKSFPGFGQRPIPALYLAMIGVELAQKGFGFGTALMTDTFERAVLVAENAGAYCLFLDAVDFATVAFYKKIGFEVLIEGDLKMFIAIETLVDALGSQKLGELRLSASPMNFACLGRHFQWLS